MTLNKALLLALLLTGLSIPNRLTGADFRHILLRKYTYNPFDGPRVLGEMVWRHADGRFLEDCTFELSGNDADKFRIRDGELIMRSGARNDLRELLTARISITAKIDDLVLATEDIVLVQDRFATNKTIAHRGAWKVANVPQNSMASLAAAQNLGCAGSEIDVYMTSDSIIILNHDPTYAKMKVESVTAKQLRNKPLPNGEPLPLLSDILRQTQTGNNTRLIIEIKSSSVGKAHALACTDRIVSMVQETGSQGWVEYISFDYDIVKRVLFWDPYAKVAYLNGDFTPEFLVKEGITGIDYNLAVLRNNPDWIPQARELGLTTNVWTVNTPEDMEYFLDQEIDVITTDEPALLIEKVENRQNGRKGEE